MIDQPNKRRAMEPSCELDQLRRVDLRRWAAAVLKLEPDGDSNKWREDAIKYALGLANPTHRTPDLREIEALHLLIHDQQPLEFLLADQMSESDSDFSAMAFSESTVKLSNDKQSLDLNNHTLTQEHVAAMKAAIKLFTEASPSKRLEIVNRAKQYLDDLPTKESKKILRALKNEYEFEPIAEQFLVYLSVHVERVRPLSKSCIDEALDRRTNPIGDESTEPFDTDFHPFTKLLIVTVVTFAIVRIFVLAPALNNEQNERKFVSVPATPGYDPQLVADHIRASFLVGIDSSPFKVVTESGLPQDYFLSLMFSKSEEQSMTSILNAMYFARRYRWLYREQHMIRSFLAEHKMPVDGKEIQLEDDGQWRVKEAAEAEEIFQFFLKPAKRWSDKVREIRDQNDLLNEDFWSSTVIDLTPREVAIVLEGDPEKTREIDSKLYLDPIEFELVRRLRKQNEPLDRSLESAYGHHRLQTNQNAVAD